MGCTCAKTESHVTCPVNHYCPEYSTFDVSVYYNSTLRPANCKVDLTGSTPYVVCPCTPGFYCPANTSQPVYCCPGFYCPSDPTVSITDEDGLGTWGALAYRCPEGKFCATGQIEPFNCPALGRCPAGSSSANKQGQWVLLIVMIIAIVIVFAAIEFYRDRQRKIQNLMFDKTKEVVQSSGRAPSAAGNSPMHSQANSAPLSDRRSFVVEFENIGLTLKNGTTIMHGVHGTFQPGRMCAVMGPR
jgi:hypothetical protein